MKHVYLVNRFNLRKRTDSVIGKLKKASEEEGRAYEIVVSDTPEEAEALKDRFRDSEDIITAIGGDGSVNQVLNQIAGTGNILSVIPFGTGNDFYHACTENPEDGIRALDIVRINDRYFINVACFGIDADIANNERFVHNRLIPRAMRYNAGVLYHFLTHRRGRRLRVEWDGHSLEKEWTTVIAANSAYYGGGYHVSPESVPDDGMLELFMVDDLGKIRMAEIILSMKKAGHLHNPALRMVRTKKMTISAEEPFLANIDGESICSDRFEIEVIEKGIRVETDRGFAEKIR